MYNPKAVEGNEANCSRGSWYLLCRGDRWFYHRFTSYNKHSLKNMSQIQEFLTALYLQSHLACGAHQISTARLWVRSYSSSAVIWPRENMGLSMAKEGWQKEVEAIKSNALLYHPWSSFFFLYYPHEIILLITLLRQIYQSCKNLQLRGTEERQEKS